MRLINTETLLLEDFILRKAPQYAILSHTWTDEEVSLQEFICQSPDTPKKEGFTKIIQTCGLAQSHNIDYAWVDTCCIDKTSSAELAKAINSMFLWYKNATACYAFLSDLPQTKKGINEWYVEYEELRKCRWFTRGWTLQELIAPRLVYFYDEIWAFRGNKDDLAESIHRITHINSLILRGKKPLTELSIAERMTWAAGRETTRAEDTAYCLLGIFDINMPLLYGEGTKAFTGLQHEIIKSNCYLSIFGWSHGTTIISVPFYFREGFHDGCKANCGHQDKDQYSDILAPSPHNFATLHSWYILDSIEHSVTNRAIIIL